MQIGYYSLDLQEPMESRLSYVAAYLRSFTGREPTPEDVGDFRRYVEQRPARLPPAGGEGKVRPSRPAPKAASASTARS
jgi:hypothetical protein